MSSKRWVRFGVLGLLCVLQASRWLLEQRFPLAASSWTSQAVGCVFAAGALFCCFWPGRPGGLLGSYRQLCGWTLALIGPAVPSVVLGTRLASSSAAIAMALTPVVVSVAGGALSKGDEDFLGAMWPGLAGVTGLLLLLPEPANTGWQTWAALGAMPVITGVGAVLGASIPGDGDESASPAPWALCTACVLAAAFYGLVATFRADPQVSWSASASALDGAGVTLSLLVLLFFRGSGWSAQFLVIPLLGLLEGIGVVRPTLDGRMWLGLGLLVVGSMRLLLRNEASSSYTPSLFHPGSE